MQGLTTFHKECAALMKDAKLFPIEVDLTRNSFQYKSTMPGESVMLDCSIYPPYHVLHSTVVQHDDDDDCNDEGIEAREAIATGGMEELLAGLGSNDDANLLDIGNGNDPVAAAADSGQPAPPDNLGDLLGGGGTGGQSLPSATRDESEAGATANLLGL